ncbi:hypothetical protein GIB67_021144 [Kingdonia uniflora]|uniref:Protein kinase domain-containing protein n=1 Tax=Kingdonia uniflora TaxID=39325 RepID=A0A7J7N772_9MAGN|nr:hypothetical protein GIB67_021144 [Kingdonia uniflora]
MFFNKLKHQDNPTVESDYHHPESFVSTSDVDEDLHARIEIDPFFFEHKTRSIRRIKVLGGSIRIDFESVPTDFVLFKQTQSLFEQKIGQPRNIYILLAASELPMSKGTRGYLAPKWITGLAITSKADIYNYGMMLLEIVSGRRNMERPGDGKFDFFPICVSRRLSNGEEILSILDYALRGEFEEQELVRACKISCWCIQDDEKNRPSMGHIVQLLEGVLQVSMPPIPLHLQSLVENLWHEGESLESSGSKKKILVIMGLSTRNDGQVHGDINEIRQDIITNCEGIISLNIKLGELDGRVAELSTTILAMQTALEARLPPPPNPSPPNPPPPNIFPLDNRQCIPNPQNFPAQISPPQLPHPPEIGQHQEYHHQHLPGQLAGFHGRPVRLDFPLFDGTDPKGWVFHAQQYQFLNGIPDKLMMDLSAGHLQKDVI